MPAAQGMQVGDVARVEVELPNPAWSALLLFLVPLVLLFAGLGVWMWLGPRPPSQGAGLLVGLALMAAWYGGVALYDRRLRGRGAGQPRLVEWRRPDSAEPG